MSGADDNKDVQMLCRVNVDGMDLRISDQNVEYNEELSELNLWRTVGRVASKNEG